MKKSELPHSDLQALETAESRIRALGADEVATQYLIANLYSSYKLVEANQEVDNLSQKLANPETQKQLNQLYLPMLHKTGDMYLKIDKKIQAEDNYKKVIELAPRAKDPEEEASARVSLGQFYSNNGRNQEAIENLKKSEQLYKQGGNDKKAAEVNKKIYAVQKQ
jgi:tetratricopeptide (TPR) repeat protein